jgi:SAM-dependent methyltransferase
MQSGNQDKINEVMQIFADPISHASLELGEDSLRLYNAVQSIVSRDGVFVFLPRTNEEYEGAYLNKIKYTPRTERFPFTIPLWMMAHGYVWEVGRQFAPGSIICELGCASGVNYFGKRYNMIGVDYSLASLRGIENYRFKVQADAIQLPFRNESLDGIVSSFFWEHIAPADKVTMLAEFSRVLKPGGKVVLLYDIETQNQLINRLKREDIKAYNTLFLEKDYHIGYETLGENKRKFEDAGFEVCKHFGMERTLWLSNSAYTKLATRNTGYGKFASMMKAVSGGVGKGYLYMFMLRLFDETIGRMWNAKKSRIAISVLKK